MRKHHGFRPDAQGQLARVATGLAQCLVGEMKSLLLVVQHHAVSLDAGVVDIHHR